MRILFLIALSLFSAKVFAYPQFIGHGYTSCLTCHYNPLGNGPLTDYGRAVSATAVAGRVWFASKSSEDKISRTSSFLFGEWKKNKYVRPSVNFRQLWLKRKVGTTNAEVDKITMVANANVVLKSADDKFYISGTIGYAPKPDGGGADLENQEEYRSREHYIGYRPTKSFGIYAGLMDKAYGLRIDDHSAYSRTTAGVAQNDQSHGVLLHYLNDKFDFGFNYFVGNMEQEDNIRQKGFSTTFEYSLYPKARIGASFLNSKSQFVKNLNYALHTRIGFGKGSSIMVEIGDVNKEGVTSTTEIPSRYYFMQNQIALTRGFYFNYALEWLVPDVETENKTLRLGPGLQWMPGQRLEFRIDVWNSRAFNPNAVSKDTWDAAGQVHLWF